MTTTTALNTLRFRLSRDVEIDTQSLLSRLTADTISMDLTPTEAAHATLENLGLPHTRYPSTRAIYSVRATDGTDLFIVWSLAALAWVVEEIAPPTREEMVDAIDTAIEMFLLEAETHARGEPDCEHAVIWRNGARALEAARVALASHF